MRKIVFERCIPTGGTKVPAGPEWLYEIKHDGYRLIVVRDGARVRLFTRNGHDWTKRYPLIVETALRNRPSSSRWRGGAAPRLPHLRFQRAALYETRRRVPAL